ncbi:cadherin-16 [Ara ararauna]
MVHSHNDTKTNVTSDSFVQDTAQFSNYHLIVQVKDLGNQSLGHCALPTVEITIEENCEIQILAGNSDRLPYSDPLMLLITVMDESDNLPAFTQEFYQIALTENTAKMLYLCVGCFVTHSQLFLLFAGSEIITVKPENINDPKTNSSEIAYEILSQEPLVSNAFSFQIGKEI